MLPIMADSPRKTSTSPRSPQPKSPKKAASPKKRSNSSSSNNAEPAPVPAPAPVVEKKSEVVPKARQIVSINEEGTKFQLDEEALDAIFHKVPADIKVAIISVVGAFRTGKSFALDLFLRYLRHAPSGRMLKKDAPADDESWKDWIKAGVHGQGDVKLEGNSNVEQTHGEKGFSWRAGRKRNTTGIWMWEEPFIRTSQTGEEIAVFLIDTQGMFDSETSQMLTASIFGLSTLLSSYQIYNVDKRVQEDNLQHLALFTEYGRMALFGRSDKDRRLSVPESVRLQKSLSTASVESAKSDDDEEGPPRPFQRLDFLVRDWQDFSLAGRKARRYEAADTREQINSCFEHVACFLLPHPGYAVTDRDFDGSVEAIDTRFLELLTAYLDDVFDPKNLFPKKIHGMAVNARELSTFIKCYAALFREASIFPEAKTLLEATAEANNVNMKDKALIAYKKEMEKVAGSKCRYVPVKELEAHHELCVQGAMTIFDNGANMGRASEIMKYRSSLVDTIEKERARFFEVNAERDPYKNLEFYLIPGIIALTLLAFRIIQDLMCYEHIGYDLPMYDCKHVSHTLSHLYWAIIVFMLLITFSTGQVMIKRVKTVIAIIQSAVNAAQEASTAGDKEKKD
ncbi:TPA: LOW QUALITY PROTEIN: hypothetical protein N0F65_007440 [Lagenidium giganteum]|uniref:GB1/RHD3-type G domain-containing protein n=1 Tax=Lagenidium giganteum TaxID=4803 RepID=A0AAV2ZCT2_9STRA|nr:TPA: LOW QUALITY PROTEIN: hypothetical protein N0F65_007440 [Lagenidium giganteum]